MQSCVSLRAGLKRMGVPVAHSFSSVRVQSAGASTYNAVVGSCDAFPALGQHIYSLGVGEGRKQSEHIVTSIKQSKSIPEILQDSKYTKALCQHPQKVDASPTRSLKILPLS